MDMTLTAPNCPVAGEMPGMVKDALEDSRRHRRGDGEHDLRSALDAGAHERRSETRTEHVLMETPMQTTAAKPRRERPKAVRLSDAAAARIREIMADADGKYQGVRVGVTNGGCAGMSYTMDYAEDVAARSTKWSRTRA